MTIPTGRAMRVARVAGSYVGTGFELLGFFWQNKWWWLTPVIAVLLLLGVLMVVAQSSAIAPFIYTVF